MSAFESDLLISVADALGLRGTHSHTTVTLSDDWLLVDAVLDGTSARPAIDVVRRNGDLGPSLKLVRPAGARQDQLRLEWPLFDVPSDTAQTLEACRQFTAALEGFSERGSETLLLVPGSANMSSPVSLELIKAACAAAGWVCTEHRSGALSVPLDVPDSACQARVIVAGSGRLRLFAELAPVEQLTPLSADAVAQVLLATSAAVHLVRSGEINRNGERWLGLEAAVLPSPSAESVHAALCALSLACAACAREVEVLAAEEIARCYLEQCA